MAVLTETTRYGGEFLMTEATGSRSREAITVVSGAGKLNAGAVLGKITASGKYTLSPATGSDGSQTAVAVLMYPVDATDADVKVTAIVRDAEVNGKVLSYAASVDDATKRGTKATQLAALGIIVR